MNKYEIRTANKKAAIMEATINLINEKGFTSTSINQIALQAKVSPVSIYNYFGSKENLVLECIKRIIFENYENARKILKSNLSYEKKLEKALSLCSSEMNTSISEYFSTISLSERNFLKILNEGCKDIQRSLYQDFIEEGKKEKAIDSTIPTETLLKFIDSFNNIQLNPNDLKSEMQNLHKLFLHGILG
jgi:AcrR family transcriptional regulator